MKLFPLCALLAISSVAAPAQQSSAVVTAAKYHDSWVGNYTDYDSSPDSSKGKYKSFRKKGEDRLADAAAFYIGLDYLDGTKGGGKKYEFNQKAAQEWFENVSPDFSLAKHSGMDGSGLSHAGYRLLGQGQPATTPNPQAAERWLKAADYLTDAEYNLGLAYLKGDIPGGTTANAISLLTTAAKSMQDGGEASVLLGQLYAEGVLVPANPALTHRYFTIAAVQLAQEEKDYRDALQRKSEWDAENARQNAAARAAMFSIIAGGLANAAAAASTPAATDTARTQAQPGINQAAQQNSRAAQQTSAQRSAFQASSSHPVGKSCNDSTQACKATGNPPPGVLSGSTNVAQISAMQQQNATAQQQAIAQLNQAVTSLVAAMSPPPDLPASGSAYTGPNAAWVHAVLGTAGAYSCSPVKAPAFPASFTCQRDALVYKAQQLAWASECSAATGQPGDAQADAAVLMDTLNAAAQLCGAQAPTGAVTCDTDTILSCSRLTQ